jgi:hypothetical protein
VGTGKRRTPLLIPIVTVILVAGLFTWIGINNVSGKAHESRESAEDAFVGVSTLKNQPHLYLGDVTVKGVASRILSEEGVIEIADEKACCSIYLLTPVNEGQPSKLKVSELYNGRYPAKGAQITASVTLRKEAEGYRFVVSRVQQDGHTLLSRQ